MSSVRSSLLLALLALSVAPATAITLTVFNVASTENFDSLSNTSASSSLPAGWAISEVGAAGDGFYGVSTGSSTTGDTYSFGAAGSTERALGTQRTDALALSFGVQINNSTGATIADLAIQYTGEQWRLGSAGRADRLDFAYSLNASSLTTGAWTDFNGLDFSSPETASTGARNGNAAANQAAFSQTISGLNLAPGATIWLRWTDFNASGADDGLAVDNFSVTALPQTAPQGVPDHASPLMMLATVGGLLISAAALRRSVQA